VKVPPRPETGPSGGAARVGSAGRCVRLSR
jgi:hypothetical protein